MGIDSYFTMHAKEEISNNGGTFGHTYYNLGTGTLFHNHELGTSLETVGTLTTSCPYFELIGSANQDVLTGVLTSECEMPRAVYEATYNAIIRPHEKYMFDTSNVEYSSFKKLHSVCDKAKVCYAGAGSKVDKAFWNCMWPHFSCWAAKLAELSGHPWAANLDAVAEEFNLNRAEMTTVSCTPLN